MKKEEVKEMINRLLQEVEEEDIGISLLSIFHQGVDELEFFKEDDRRRVVEILKKLSEDSRRHKVLIEKIINHLGKKCEAGKSHAK